MCGSSPSVPDTPPPPKPVREKEVVAAATEAREAQKEKAKASQGVSSTVLTSATGLDHAARTTKKLLG